MPQSSVADCSRFLIALLLHPPLCFLLITSVPFGIHILYLFFLVFFVRTMVSRLLKG